MSHFFKFRLTNRVLALVTPPYSVKMNLIDNITNAETLEDMFVLEGLIEVWEKDQYETAV